MRSQSVQQNQGFHSHHVFTKKQTEVIGDPKRKLKKEDKEEQQTDFVIDTIDSTDSLQTKLKTKKRNKNKAVNKSQQLLRDAFPTFSTSFMSHTGQEWMKEYPVNP